MTVYEALTQRHSTRAFQDKPVEKEKITRILEGARHAPSGVNMQPWEIAVIQGRMKTLLQEQIIKAFERGHRESMDYRYYPREWEEPYKSRRKTCGLKMYEALGISREDKERQKEQWLANYRAFDAPVMILCFMKAGLESGSFLDYGMFIQSLMLMAEEEGLATCPQAALAEYPTITKEFLEWPQDDLLLCGIALGYASQDAPVNGYRTSREEVDSFTRFFE